MNETDELVRTEHSDGQLDVEREQQIKLNRMWPGHFVVKMPSVAARLKWKGDFGESMEETKRRRENVSISIKFFVRLAHHDGWFSLNKFK